MPDEWLTYSQAAERLNMTVEAVRLRALRGRWQKTIGNDRRPRIRLPEGWSNDGRTANERRERKPRNDVRTTVERTVDPGIVNALEGHIATLKGDVERLEAQLRIEADRFAEAEARNSQLATELTAEREKIEAERAKTDKAIAAFAALAERLDALAAERALPWWRRPWRRTG